MVKIAVNGALGRMGSRILALASESPREFTVAGAFDPKNNSTLTAERLKGCEVLIDFSGPEGTQAALNEAVKAGAALVIGTTGLDAEAQKKIKTASTRIPIVLSSNMSVGVNLVSQLVHMAASKLGADFKIKITETHHVHKKDAPSGTALMLRDAIGAEKEVEIKSIREGEIVGDHTVLFAGPAETIEITHRAHSRDAFARGALVAALFLSKKQNGLYTMADVLNVF